MLGQYYKSTARGFGDLPAHCLLVCVLQRRILLHVPIDMREDIPVASILQSYPDTCVEMVHKSRPPRVVRVGGPVDDKAKFDFWVVFELSADGVYVGHCFSGLGRRGGDGGCDWMW